MVTVGTHCWQTFYMSGRSANCRWIAVFKLHTVLSLHWYRSRATREQNETTNVHQQFSSFHKSQTCKANVVTMAPKDIGLRDGPTDGRMKDIDSTYNWTSMAVVHLAYRASSSGAERSEWNTVSEQATLQMLSSSLCLFTCYASDAVLRGVDVCKSTGLFQ